MSINNHTISSNSSARNFLKRGLNPLGLVKKENKTTKEQAGSDK